MTLVSILSLTTLLSRWLSEEVVVTECRNCGVTLDQSRDVCPECGAEEIARYDALE